jgi:putative glutamine amidotransferase
MPLIGIICDLQSHKDGSRTHRAGDEYVRAVQDVARAQAVLIPAAGPLDSHALLARLDGILFTGAPSNIAPHRYGSADPGTHPDEARDGASLSLIPAAIAAGVPVFCICRGFQELNVALGGTLNPDVAQSGLDHREDEAAPLSAQYAPAHAVTIAPDGLLSQLLNVQTVMVNSLHVQGIARLAPGLKAEAHAPDGLIEAVSLPSAGGFVLGVQWHPEWHAASDSVSKALFSDFGRAVESYATANGKMSLARKK